MGSPAVRIKTERSSAPRPFGLLAEFDLKEIEAMVAPRKVVKN